MLRIVREVPGFQGAKEYLATYPPDLYPSDSGSEVPFIVGQFHYSLDDYGASLESLGYVDESVEESFLGARYFEGAIHARKNKAKQSSDAFKNILRYVQKKTVKSGTASRYEEKALMAMARIFYSTGDFERALKYYEEITKYSPNWLQALFERSWTYFRMQRFERAMGNLHTLNSPYFEEQYFPEWARSLRGSGAHHIIMS